MKKRILGISMALVLIVVLAMPISTWAESTGFTVLTGQNDASISITVPGTMSLDLTGSGNKNGTGSFTISSYSGGSGWSVSIIDHNSDVGTKGYMMKDSTPLGSVLLLGSSNPADTSAATGLTYTGSGTSANTLYFRQAMTGTEAAGNYTMQLDFTATVTP
jgi:hypothetical protein